MVKEGKYGLYEIITMTSLVMIMKIFYTTPSTAIFLFGTSAWYGTWISVIVSAVFFLLLCILINRFPGKNLIEIFQLVMGNFIGRILAVIFGGYFLYYAASSLREFLEIIKTYSFPYTQPSIILGAFIISSIVLLFLGLDIIIRVSTVSFIPIIVSLALLLILAYNYYDIDYIYPILGHDVRTTLFHGFVRNSAYNEVVIIAAIANCIYGTKSFKKAGLISLGIAGAVISIALLCYIMAFEYFGATENLSGLFQISRIIYLSRFFQRIESIFIFIWVVISLITVTVTLYIAISTYCKAFYIANHKPLIFPFAYLLFMIALIPKNLSEVIEINMKVIRQYSSILVYGIPLLVLLFSLILKKKDVRTNVKKN